jgi:hypothetical protein
VAEPHYVLHHLPGDGHYRPLADLVQAVDPAHLLQDLLLSHWTSPLNQILQELHSELSQRFLVGFLVAAVDWLLTCLHFFYSVSEEGIIGVLYV